MIPTGFMNNNPYAGNPFPFQQPQFATNPIYVEEPYLPRNPPRPRYQASISNS